MGETAFKDCEEQGMLNIRNKEECKAACDELGIPIDNLRDNRICIRAGNQKCACDQSSFLDEVRKRNYI